MSGFASSEPKIYGFWFRKRFASQLEAKTVDFWFGREISLCDFYHKMGFYQVFCDDNFEILLWKWPSNIIWLQILWDLGQTLPWLCLPKLGAVINESTNGEGPDFESFDFLVARLQEFADPMPTKLCKQKQTLQCWACADEFCKRKTVSFWIICLEKAY